MVDSFTRLVYTRIYEDDANAVLWLSTICLAIHPIRDFPRCSLCQVKMTGHRPIGGGSGGAYPKFETGAQLSHFDAENDAGNITCGLGDISLPRSRF